MIFPTLEDIVADNRAHTESAGHWFADPDNLKEKGSVEWVLEVIQYPLFGIDKYPTVVEKAAILAWIIISGHVFWDGNKRTGMSVMATFLRVNGYKIEVNNDEMVETACLIAGKYRDVDYIIEHLVSWLREKLAILQ